MDLARTLAVRFGSGRLLFAFGVLVTFTLFRMAPLGGWDDAFYLAQLTSVIGDGDLMLQDDLLAVENEFPLRFRTIVPELPEGVNPNAFGIGVAVLHSTYLWPVVRSTSDLSGAFRQLLSLGSMAMLVLTTLATAALLRRFGHAERTRALAVAVAVLGGPLAIYGTRSYVNSHLPGAFCASFLLLAVVRWCDTALLRHAVWMGLAGGTLCIVRWQDCVLLAACAPAVLVAWHGDKSQRRRRQMGMAIAVGTVALVALIQLLAFERQFGEWFLVPQGPGYVRWLKPATVSFLLSPYHGVLTWAPGLALGLLGLVAQWRRSSGPARALCGGLLGALPLVVYLCSVPIDWWGGDSFGPRRLASLTPAAALGLAAVLSSLPWRVGVTVAAGLASWGLFVSSVFLSRWDDLRLFFFGRPAADNPTNPVVPPGWIDSWGPLHSLKPGFTFSDAPDDVDRIVGLVATLTLVGAAVGLWKGASRRPGLQRLLIACAAAWVGVWISVLSLVVPSNRSWDLAWRRTIYDCADVSPTLPRGVRGATRVALAVLALGRGDEGEADRQLRRARTGDFPAVELGEVRASLDAPELQRLIESVTAKRRGCGGRRPRGL